MLSKDKKYFALDRIIFECGDVIVHKALGYTAEIKSLHKRGSGLITVPNTPENKKVWGENLPKTFKALNIAKTFRKQLTNPTLEL